MISGISDQVDKMVQSIVLPQARPVDIDSAAVKKPPVPVEQKVSAKTEANPETDTPNTPKAEIDPSVLKGLIGDINEETARMGYRLSLSVDKDTNRVLIRFKDPSSGEVVRQIPSDVVLEIAKRLDELKGALFDSQG